MSKPNRTPNSHSLLLWSLGPLLVTACAGDAAPSAADLPAPPEVETQLAAAPAEPGALPIAVLLGGSCVEADPDCALESPAARAQRALVGASPSEPTASPAIVDALPAGATLSSAEGASLDTSVELELHATLGHAALGIVAGPNGSYAAPLAGLRENGQAVTVIATAGGTTSPAVAFQTGPGAPVSLTPIVITPQVWVGSPTAHVAVQVRDALGATVGQGVVVEASVVEPAAGDDPASCVTTAAGQCLLSVAVPEAAFDEGAGVTLALAAGEAVAGVTVQAQPAPADLDIESPGAGLQLPTAPVGAGETFDVPLYVESADVEAGAYDMTIGFDPSRVALTAVSPGSCEAFAEPVHNLTVANDAGALKINGINTMQGVACAAESRVHVGTLTFTALAAADFGAASTEVPIDCVATGLFSIDFAHLASYTACAQAGAVRLRSDEPAGIFVDVASPELLAWGPITGASDATVATTVAWFPDLTSVTLTAADGVALTMADPAIAAVEGAVVSAGDEAGTTTLRAEWGDRVATASVWVLALDSVALSLTDDHLGRIAGGPVHQTAGLRVVATWTDGAAVAWQQDVTDQVPPERFGLPGSVSWDPEGRTVSTDGTPGAQVIALFASDDAELASTTLTVSDDAVGLAALTVHAPCRVTVGDVVQDQDSGSEAIVTVQVDPVLSFAGATCQQQVYAHFEDGARMNVTGRADVTFTAIDPELATTTNTGRVTAFASGEAAFEAAFAPGGAPLATASATVTIALP